MMDEKMTTEEFHRLLKENTAIQCAERSRHHGELARIKNAYIHAIDEIEDKEALALDGLREARSEWEKAEAFFDDRKRSLTKKRHLVGQLLNNDKMLESNRHAANNVKIQSERHNIFERYRLSGGVLTGDASEMLHPSWTKREKGAGDGDV